MKEIDAIIKFYRENNDLRFTFNEANIPLETVFAKDGFLPVFVNRTMRMIEEFFAMKGQIQITDVKNQYLQKSVEFELQEIPSTIFILTFLTIVKYFAYEGTVEMDDFIYEF